MRTLIAAVCVALLLTACSARQTPSSAEKPALVERVVGTNLNRVTLSESAAKRLGIRVAPVRLEQVVRRRIVGAEVATAQTDGFVVRVRLNESDFEQVDVSQPALVLPRPPGRESGIAFATVGIAVQHIQSPSMEGAEPELLYASDGRDQALLGGQRVSIELPLLGGGERTVVPYSAVLYDLEGETWIYAQTQPRTFIRHPIEIEYIENDRAVLQSGPLAGTEAVIAGAMELFGAESGLGK